MKVLGEKEKFVGWNCFMSESVFNYACLGYIFIKYKKMFFYR